jgi:hypothetical protein
MMEAGDDIALFLDDEEYQQQLQQQQQQSSLIGPDGHPNLSLLPASPTGSSSSSGGPHVSAAEEALGLASDRHWQRTADWNRFVSTLATGADGGKAKVHAGSTNGAAARPGTAPIQRGNHTAQTSSSLAGEAPPIAAAAAAASEAAAAAALAANDSEFAHIRDPTGKSSIHIAGPNEVFAAQSEILAAREARLNDIPKSLLPRREYEGLTIEQPHPDRQPDANAAIRARDKELAARARRLLPPSVAPRPAQSGGGGGVGGRVVVVEAGGEALLRAQRRGFLAHFAAGSNSFEWHAPEHPLAQPSATSALSARKCHEDCGCLVDAHPPNEHHLHEARLRKLLQKQQQQQRPSTARPASAVVVHPRRAIVLVPRGGASAQTSRPSSPPKASAAAVPSSSVRRISVRPATANVVSSAVRGELGMLATRAALASADVLGAPSSSSVGGNSFLLRRGGGSGLGNDAAGKVMSRRKRAQAFSVTVTNVNRASQQLARLQEMRARKLALQGLHGKEVEKLEQERLALLEMQARADSGNGPSSFAMPSAQRQQSTDDEGGLDASGSRPTTAPGAGGAAGPHSHFHRRQRSTPAGFDIEAYAHPKLKRTDDDEGDDNGQGKDGGRRGEDEDGDGAEVAVPRPQLPLHLLHHRSSMTSVLLASAEHGESDSSTTVPASGGRGGGGVGGDPDADFATTPSPAEIAHAHAMLAMAARPTPASVARNLQPRPPPSQQPRNKRASMHARAGSEW